jgi:hypothetical protein
MDFEALATAIGRQFTVIGQAPIPYIVSALLLGFVIWKAMDWRYNGIIEKLQADAAYLERTIARDSNRDTPPALPALSPALPHNRAGRTIQREADRAFLPSSVTIEFMAKLRNDLTGAQADKIVSTYVGKWMKISGAVGKTGIRNGEAFIALEPDRSKPAREWLSEQATLWFLETNHAIETLEKGDLVEAQGMIEDVSDLGIILIRCELLS